MSLTPHTPAQILRFPSKRGRPKSNRPLQDTGTPELVMKRLLGQTSEALDLCLERGVITQRQHWCGVHLRWLYTLRHGAPSIRTIDLTHTGGSEPNLEDPDWRQDREAEYAQAIKKLYQSGHALMLMNLCVFNERPKFLNMPKEEIARNIDSISDSIARIRDGLDVLARLWEREA